MTLIKSSKKLPRLFVKIVNNFKSVFFNFFYYTLEVPWVSYNKYIVKNNLKRLKVQYPAIAPIELMDVKFLMYLKSKGSTEEWVLKGGGDEKELLRMADSFVKPETAIIDIGANIGVFSLYFAKKHKDCRIYSYEPTTYAFECLKKSKELNQSDNLKVFKLAAGENSWQGEIYGPTEKTYNKGLGSINFNADIEGNKTYVKEKIDVVSLDEHIGFDKNISLIKIDVQGTELSVLRGARKLIQKNKPVILVEIDDNYYDRPQEIRRSIKALFTSAEGQDDYEFYRIKFGHVKRSYLFLEELDLDEAERVNDDVLMVPK